MKFSDNVITLCRNGIWKITLVFLYMHLFLVSNPSLAQDKNDKDTLNDEEKFWELDLEQLTNVKLSSGSFLDLDLHNSALSLTIITREQIVLSNARHLSELLEIYVPGFQYMYNKWNGIIWGMRGIAVDRNTKFIFLVNGHRMNTEARDGANTELDLGIMGQIQRVEVIRGSAGWIYGSGAIAGVVNIVTEVYQRDEGKLSTMQGAWQGENFYHQYEASIATKINENANIIIGGGYRKSDGIGNERGRLWGRPSYPYPQGQDNPPPNGVPTSGSAWSTPGNRRLTADFNYKKFRYYGRYTYQVTNGSGLYIVDPWPDYLSGDTTAPDRQVDGVFRSIDGWYGGIDPSDNNRRQYVNINFANAFTYTKPIKKNELILNAGFDMNTNRIQYEDLKGYVNSFPQERHTFINETFGEKRYTLAGLYLIRSIKKLQVATGYMFNVFDIGYDMSGRDAQNENPEHPIVSKVVYLNNSFYTEGLYELHKKLNIQFALRYSIHTRTAFLGGVLVPKLALVYQPSELHSIKLIGQMAANNGSADNYEYGRYTINDEGQPFSGPDYHYTSEFSKPGSFAPIVPPVTQQELHSLKPEKSRSFELTSVHSLAEKKILASPSISYNTITDLFTWNQKLFRVINSGSFSFINAEIDAKYHSVKTSLGISHVYSRLVNTRLSENYEYFELKVFEGYDSTEVSPGRYKYMPRPVKSKADPSADSVTQLRINSLREQVTVDGKYFLNLNTNITKIYLDYKLSGWMTIHTDLRIFWGLNGRKEIHEYDSTNTNPDLDDYRASYLNNRKYPYLGIHNRAMIKWNLGINFEINELLSFSVHGYDLLAGVNPIHTLRWQQTATSQDQTDLYGIDLTFFAVKLNYKFRL